MRSGIAESRIGVLVGSNPFPCLHLHQFRARCYVNVLNVLHALDFSMNHHDPAHVHGSLESSIVLFSIVVPAPSAALVTPKAHHKLYGGFIPTCSSGTQNTTSLSALANMLKRGFHSTTLALPLHGSPHKGFNCFVSTSTCPWASHTTTSRSPPEPPTRYRPSALKHTSPCPRRPVVPGAARRFVGSWDRTQCARRDPSKASRRR